MTPSSVPAPRGTAPPDDPPTRPSSSRSPGRLALLLAVAALLAAGGLASVGGVAGADTVQSGSSASTGEGSVNISVVPERPVAHEEVTFRAQTADVDVLHYTWEIRSASGRLLSYRSVDGTTSPNRSNDSAADSFETPSVVNYTFPTGGTYTVELTANVDPGGVDSFTRTVRVRHRELAARIDVNESEVLEGEPFTLRTTNSTGNVTRARVEYGGGQTLFDFPRALHDSAPSIFPPEARLQVHAYQQAGEHPISFTVWNATNASDTVREHVQVREEDPEADERLTARFEAEHTSTRNDTRENRTVSFDATGTTGTATEYWWFFGDGSRNVTRMPETVAQYQHNGTYEVTVIAVGPNATDRTSEPVVVGDPPLDDASIAVSSPEHVTPDDRVTLTVEPRPGSVETFRWQFSDGTRRNRSLSASVTRNWSQSGRYPVEVTMVHYDGTTTTLRRNVTVEPQQASIDLAAGGEHAVAGYPVRLRLSDWNGSLASYEWTFGDGTNATRELGASAWHIYEDPGTYTVQVAAEGYEGRKTVVNETVTVVENASGSFDLGLHASIGAPRIGYPLVLDAEASGAIPSEYVWKLPSRYDHDWERTGSRSVDHTGETAGNQTVVVFARDGTAVARATTTIDVQSRTDELVQVDPTSPRAGENATLSLDLPPEQVVNASWTFGENEARGRVVEGSFDRSGTFYVDASFYDVAGEEHFESTTVEVQPGDDGGDDGQRDDGDSGGNDDSETGDSSGTFNPPPAPDPLVQPVYEIVSVDPPGEVEAGTEVEPTVTVENTGDVLSGQLTVDVWGRPQTRVQVEAGTNGTDTVTPSIIAPERAGEYDLRIQTANDLHRHDLTVVGSGDESGSGGDQSADGGDGGPSGDDATNGSGTDGDGTTDETADRSSSSDGASPGFGALGALLALAAGALGLRRRA